MQYQLNISYTPFPSVLQHHQWSIISPPCVLHLLAPHNLHRVNIVKSNHLSHNIVESTTILVLFVYIGGIKCTLLQKNQCQIVLLMPKVIAFITYCTKIWLCCRHTLLRCEHYLRVDSQLYYFPQFSQYAISHNKVSEDRSVYDITNVDHSPGFFFVRVADCLSHGRMTMEMGD